MFGLGTPMIVLGIVAALAGAGAYWQYDRANGFAVDLAAETAQRQADANGYKASLATQAASIGRLEAARAEDQRQLNALAVSSARITEERDAVLRKYDEYRGRIDRLATGKPELIGRNASAATNRVLDRLWRATRPVRGAEQTDPALPPAAAAGDQPARPRRSRGAHAGTDRFMERGGRRRHPAALHDLRLRRAGLFRLRAGVARA
jgi:hypothetical protein